MVGRFVSERRIRQLFGIRRIGRGVSSSLCANVVVT